MAKAIERVVSPEERELNRYLTTIESRKRQLASLQADLETLREDLARFSAEYHARIGLVLLDAERMEREAAEYRLRTELLRQDPALNKAEIDDQVRRQFGPEWEQHRQDQEHSERFREQARKFREEPPLTGEERVTLTQLFRDLAKRFHPDLAESVDEVAERTRVMQQATEAFHRRDLEALRRLAETQEPASVLAGRSLAERLVWAIREVARLDGLLDELSIQVGSLKASDLGSLWHEHLEGTRPIDLLEEEAQRRRRVAEVKLHDAVSRFRQESGVS